MPPATAYHHQSNSYKTSNGSVVVDQDEEDDLVERYKAILRQQHQKEADDDEDLVVYEESTHPTEFLGGSEHADSVAASAFTNRNNSPKKKNQHNGSSHHSWASSHHSSHHDPTLRSGEWLTPTAGSSPTKRSWHPKSAPLWKSKLEGTTTNTASMLTALPFENDDDDDVVVNKKQQEKEEDAEVLGLGSSSSSHHERRQALKEAGHPHVPRRWKGQRSSSSHHETTRTTTDDLLDKGGSNHSIGSFASDTVGGMSSTAPAVSTTTTTTSSSTTTTSNNNNNNNNHDTETTKTTVVRKRFKNGTPTITATTGVPIQPKRMPSLDRPTMADAFWELDRLQKQEQQRQKDDETATVFEVASTDDDDDDEEEERMVQTPVKTPQAKAANLTKATTTTPTTKKKKNNNNFERRSVSLTPVRSSTTTGGVAASSAPVTPSTITSQRGILDEEKISTKKFTAAFAAFEKNASTFSPHKRFQSLQAQPPPTSSSSSMPGSAYKPRSQEEKEAAEKKRAQHRNKVVSAANRSSTAAQRSSTMAVTGGKGSSYDYDSPSTPETAALAPPRRIQSLISPRYNVRRNFTISKDALLKDRSLSTTQRKQDSVLNLQDIIAHLRKVQRHQKNTTTTPKTDNILQDMLRRLRHVGNLSPADQEAELTDMLRQLQSVDALGDQNVEQLQSMLDTLNSSMIEKASEHNNEAKSTPQPIKKKVRDVSRLEPEDHDWLQSALRRLKKTQLTPREADAVADTVLKLKHVAMSDRDGEAESDAMIGRLCDQALVYPTRKAHEVAPVLQGLRRIDLNDTERKDFAKQIRGIAVENHHIDEFSEAILRLKKAGLNKWEAGQVSGIMIDLRKTIKNARAGIDEEDDDEESVDDNYNRLTRQELRKLIDDTKMDTIDAVTESLKKVLSKVTDQEMVDFTKALLHAGNGDANNKQQEHQDYVDVLADAIRNLKRAHLNKWEAKEVSGIISSLRKTQYPNRWDNGDNRQMVNLRKVATPEQMNIIEDVVKKVEKAVRFSGNDEIFEFFLDDIVATGRIEPTREQIALYAALENKEEEEDTVAESDGDDLSYDDLKSDGGDDDADEVASVDTMAISISSADITLGEEEVELTDSEDEKSIEASPPKSSTSRKLPVTIANPFPNRNNQLANFGSRSCPASPTADDSNDKRKIVFTRKHHWKHKQHNTTVVGEKRWRLCEDFDTDEVIFSPLSKDQHNRRKAVEGSLKQSLSLMGLEGGSTRSLNHVNMDGDEDNEQEEAEEMHVDAVERRLRENNLDLEGMLKKGESSKRSVCLTPSPKRSMSARRLVMTNQPGELPF